MLQEGIEAIADLNDYGNNYPEYKRGQIDLLMHLVGFADNADTLHAYIVSEINSLCNAHQNQLAQHCRSGSNPTSTTRTTLRKPL